MSKLSVLKRRVLGADADEVTFDDDDDALGAYAIPEGPGGETGVTSVFFFFPLVARRARARASLGSSRVWNESSLAKRRIASPRASVV